ncbi:MAG: hypothetical protein CM1200mP33_7630 [Chloroflexota bacterium]|nr:MAG: hypothetical protein CM1200mP33_7630 [Chloroflexota bacterium]
MIQSMTGYGRGTAGKGINKVTSYIKVVNGRHLDIKFRGIELILMIIIILEIF